MITYANNTILDHQQYD